MPTILVTGSSGKTSSRVSKLLHQNGHPFLIASRKGNAPAPYADKGVPFDWMDKGTFENPFAKANDISAVYLVAPSQGTPVQNLIDFIDLAVARNVKRFVLLSASLVDAGSKLWVGPAHAHLIKLGESKGVEWAVLRPTWFMENFTEAYSKQSIVEHNAFNTATGDGRIPFISCEDIAAVAYSTLTDTRAHNTDYIVLGPQLLTYDEVARDMSQILGRTITHNKHSVEEMANIMKNIGIPAVTAEPLAAMEGSVAHGAEDRMNSAVYEVTGKPPKDFKTFIAENKSVWMKT